MDVEHYIPAKHEAAIMSWFKSYGVADRIMPGTMSPFGGVVIDEEGPVMAGFLYLSVGCSVCFVERLTARPGNTPGVARLAGAVLFGFLVELARQHGYEHLYANAERPALACEMEDLGFTILASNSTLLTMPL